MVTTREGDWECPDCGMLVFASKDTCFKCSPGGKGGGKERREGDWNCPDCGALVFASKDTCFRCEKGWPGSGGKGDRRAGDWTCPACGENVFASKTECFKCGAHKPSGKNAAKAPKAPKAAQAGAVSAAASIKALAKLSPKFRKAWVAYCASYGMGVSNPGEHEEDFLEEFAEYVGDLVSSDAATAAPADKAAKRPAEAAPTGAPPEKKKLTIKKAVADEIRRLNAAGGLLAQIRVAAVADALGTLGEEGALAALAALEEQQAETEDPNEFLNNVELEEDDG